MYSESCHGVIILLIGIKSSKWHWTTTEWSEKRIRQIFLYTHHIPFTCIFMHFWHGRSYHNTSEIHWNHLCSILLINCSKYFPLCRNASVQIPGYGALQMSVIDWSHEKETIYFLSHNSFLTHLPRQPVLLQQVWMTLGCLEAIWPVWLDHTYKNKQNTHLEMWLKCQHAIYNIQYWDSIQKTFVQDPTETFYLWHISIAKDIQHTGTINISIDMPTFI